MLLSRFFAGAITNPCTAEQLRTGKAGAQLITLTDHLSLNCTNPAIVNALLYVTALRGRLKNPACDPPDHTSFA